MLKRLSRKLITMSVLVIALAGVSYAPAAPTNRTVYCLDGPITDDCASGYYCCDLSGNCTCSPR